jgi:hypothetical protein
MRTAHQGALEVRWRFASWVRSSWRTVGSIAYGGARQRAVLALLVLHANQVVASGRVLLELWRGRPAGSGQCAAGGRLAAAPALRAGRLVTRHGGTCSAPTPMRSTWAGSSDCSPRDARPLPRADAEQLALALSLWRGPALADSRDEPVTQAEISRLDELRLIGEQPLCERCA